MLSVCVSLFYLSVPVCVFFCYYLGCGVVDTENSFLILMQIMTKFLLNKYKDIQTHRYPTKHYLPTCTVKIGNYSKTCLRDHLSSETTSHLRPQFGCTNSFSYIFNLSSETTLQCKTKGHFFVATSPYFTCQ